MARQFAADTARRIASAARGCSQPRHAGANPTRRRPMATHAATRNISGLARALAQHGLMSEDEAEALQTQAQPSGVHVRRAGAAGKRMTRAAARGVRLARVRRAAARPRRASTSTRSRRSTVDPRSPQTRRVLPLHKRGNRLYVATSDPANLQALEEVRFKTNLVVEPVVVEDDKLGAGDRTSWSRRRGATLQGHGEPRGPRGRPRRTASVRRRSRRGQLRGRGRAGRPVHPEDPARRDHRRRLGHPLRAVREVLPDPLPRSTAS